MGRKRLRDKERLKLFEDEKELRELGILGKPMADCDAILASDAPCPWARCKLHTGITVSVQGAVDTVRLSHPGKDFDELEETCALRFARKRRGASLASVGKVLGVHLERVRQHQKDAFRKILVHPMGQEILRALLEGHAF